MKFSIYLNRRVFVMKREDRFLYYPLQNVYTAATFSDLSVFPNYSLDKVDFLDKIYQVSKEYRPSKKTSLSPTNLGSISKG